VSAGDVKRKGADVDWVMIGGFALLALAILMVVIGILTAIRMRRGRRR